MSSHPRPEMPGSASRHRVAGDSSAPPPPPPPDDPLSANLPPSDDTPTIITRHLAAVTATPASAPAPPPDDPAAGIRGRRLAHFELIEPIGVGGMAAVLRARDTQLDRLVALKILPPETANDSEIVRRFHQEARAAARLDHENIARVFYCGEDQRLHFIAFEFVEGENLRTLLERRGRLPAGEAVHYMLQVAAGLAHAARRGVVHRDIKPSNIIITPNGRAKLVDMGLARSLEPHGYGELTQSGVTLGTFDYISPEQALEPREADFRSDIYSLGCTFYHVLTGRPPVPDGTAAKKLHHQQHVKPVDPRHYVPDLPLEVVRLLDRMMAKDPGDRFESPEQLVQQLLAVARKLGAAPEVPEGVLSLEADLPAPHAGRPLLWVAVAAVLVVGLVLLLEQAPTGGPAPPKKADATSSAGEGKAAAKPGPTPEKGAEEPPPARNTGKEEPKRARYVAPDNLGGPLERADHLARWLEQQQDAGELALELSGDIDLSQLKGDDESRGLRVAADKVTIKPRRPGEAVTIRFDYDSEAAPKSLVALTIEAKEAAIDGVRFVVDAHESGVELDALRLLGGKHTVTRCTFIQAQPSLRPDAPRFASVHASPGKGGQHGELTLSECAFLGFAKRSAAGEAEAAGEQFKGAASGGQVALLRDGAVSVTARSCVFGPHAAVARLEKSASGDAGQVKLLSCSLLLAGGRSAAFEVAAGATGVLGAEGCLIARGPGDAEEGAVVIRQQNDGADAATFRGKDNCYHGLDGYWLVEGQLEQAGWGNFRAKVAGRTRPGEDARPRVDPSEDDRSRVALSNPWGHEAEEQLRLLEQERVAAAFQANLLLGALRRHSMSETEVVGATRILGESWLPETLPALPEKPEQAGRRLLVVEPNASGEDDPGNGVFASLQTALPRARPTDTILLRTNGEMKTDPVALNKVDLKDLTIKAARRFRPALALGTPTEAEAALFRVHDGTLRLEGLEFRLRPPEGDVRSLSVVALAGDGICVLRDCVVTLGRSGEKEKALADKALAVAALVEASKVMKRDMPPARPRGQGPMLEVRGCFVRGEGDLLWCRANRPFEAVVEETVAALTGSLVNVEVSPEGAAPEAQQMDVKLKRATTYLGGHLLHLNVSKDPRGLVPFSCDARHCLFWPAPGGKTLVQLDGPDGEEKTLREKFTWWGKQNGYGAYTSLLAQETGDGMASPMGMDKWKMLPGEDQSTFGVKMERPPDAAFGQLDPGQLKPPDALRDMGATAGRTPRPWRP